MKAPSSDEQRVVAMSTNDAAKPLGSASNAKKRREPKFGLGLRVVLGAALGLLLVGGIGGWAMSAKLSGAVIAPGSVTVSEHVKLVQHRDGGIVSEIMVRKGDS